MTIDPIAILRGAAVAPEFFLGFREVVIDGPAGPVFARIGGSGPPLLLLHGYPQTSAMWHLIAPELAREYTVICADLRGYGRSARPPTCSDHSQMSKRAMAGDLLALMDALGHDRFLVGAHDRGARVAHRLAADHPGRVRALAMLDIAPTREMYAHGDAGFAADYWHWYWLIQPEPLPERLIGAAPDWFWCCKCCVGKAGATAFARQALGEYLSAFRDPDTIHASCEDYRAAWGIDQEHDDAETARLPMPLLALWGEDGAIEAHFDCLGLWRLRAADVQGRALPGGHYLAEECPDAVLADWLPFFAGAPV